MNSDSPRKNELDPEIQQFVSYLLTRTSQLGYDKPSNYGERRRNAEVVRQPLTVGGPDVEKSFDYQVPVGDGTVRIRVVNAAPGDASPALVYVHGGGWMLFSIETHGRIMRELASQAGIAVVGVEYSLSPDARYPVQLDEISAVIDWLRENEQQAGIDSNRLVIGGDSAGANLSIATCLALRSRSALDGVLGMLLCYGVYDSGLETESYERYAHSGYVLSREEMLEFWRCYVRSPADLDDPLVSPLRAELRGLPSAFLVIAECDVLHDENVEMAVKLTESGVDVQATVYEGTTHSFLEAVSMAEVSRRALSDAAHWLHKRLHRK